MNHSIRFGTARFHCDSGSEALFERVCYKMRETRELELHVVHFQQRVQECRISDSVLASLKSFDSGRWVTVTITVRTDTGKFEASTRELIFPERTVSVTIGLHNMVQTIMWKEPRGVGYSYVVSDRLFKLVEEVNQQLMMNDAEEGA